MHDVLQMTSEMLRQRPTQGGFNAWAAHIMEPIDIAKKAIRPHPLPGPQAPGTGGTHPLPTLGPASCEALLALDGAERDVSHAALLLLQIPVASLEAQHAGNHQD